MSAHTNLPARVVGPVIELTYISHGAAVGALGNLEDQCGAMKRLIRAAEVAVITLELVGAPASADKLRAAIVEATKATP